MKIKDLINQLKQVDENNHVFLRENGLVYDFTGISFDDLNDVELYICGTDKEV